MGVHCFATHAHQKSFHPRVFLSGKLGGRDKISKLVYNAGMEPLRQITLFSVLSEKTLTILKQHLIERRYESGELIQLEADPARGAHFITRGRVQILRTSADGKEQILANLGPGEAFNVVPLFEPDGVNPASARALTPAQTGFLLREPFLRLVEHSPDLAFALLKDFAGKLATLTGLVEQLSLHTIRGRLARFLIEQADSSPELPGRWTQDEMAAHLGTVRDVVGRTLRAFEEAGLIERRQGRIVLLNRGALEIEAEL